MKPNTYHHNNFRRYRTYSPVKAWNDATATIHRRQERMKRAAGVYKPGSEHYPMPEPGTENINRRINDYFSRITTQEHERLTNTLTPQERETVYGY